MGTISSSLASNPATTPATATGSSSSSSGSGSSSGIFTGSSQYSQDFQNSIARTVAIASLPIQELTNQQNALTRQSTELSALDASFTALQTSVQGIGQALNGSSFQADVSTPSAVSATLSDGAVQGNYAIQVTNIGAYATSLSTSAWDSTPVAPTTYQLVIGGVNHSLTPADNSAATIASTINSLYGNLVQASVVNVGPADTPDYRISLQSTKLGDAPVDLQKTAGVSLQTPQTVGALAQYVVDNSGVTVSSNTRSVSISTGVTLNLLTTSTGPVNVTVTRSTSALSAALSSFADAYNTAAGQVGAERGQSAGALQAQTIVASLSSVLSGLSTYSAPNGQINGLASLGLSLGTDGQITYNAFTLLSADLSDTAGVTSFLGSATGGGFLQSATNALSGLETPVTGLLKITETGVQDRITSLGTQISTKQDQVTALQTRLQAQMASADALIATMEQQYSFLSNMFSAEQTASLSFSR
jgi:flagellar hook-associated protein 2